MLRARTTSVRHCRATAAGLAAVVLLAGCNSSDGGAGDTAASSTSTTPADTSSATAASTGAVATTAATSTPTSTPGTTTRTVHLTQFQSPSHNIGCYLDGAGARCDISQKSWTPPPKPADCELDWGGGLSVDTKRSRVVCAGDTVLDPSAPVLAYGEASEAGAFVCVSDQTGMTCTHRPSGYGFQLSRQSYKLF